MDEIILLGANEMPVRLADLRKVLERTLAARPLSPPDDCRWPFGRMAMRRALPTRSADEIRQAQRAAEQARRDSARARAKRMAGGRRVQLSLADRLEKQGKLERQHVDAWNEISAFLEVCQSAFGLAINYDNMLKIDGSVRDCTLLYAGRVREVYQNCYLP